MSATRSRLPFYPPRRRARHSHVRYMPRHTRHEACWTLGGTLYQDVGTQIAPTASAHQQPEPYGEPTHSLTLVKDSPLNRLWKSESMMVNSMHHQAIKRPADCLKPMAYAPEGFVEAVDTRRQVVRARGAVAPGIHGRKQHSGIRARPSARNGARVPS